MNVVMLLDGTIIVCFSINAILRMDERCMRTTHVRIVVRTHARSLQAITDADDANPRGAPPAPSWPSAKRATRAPSTLHPSPTPRGSSRSASKSSDRAASPAEAPVPPVETCVASPANHNLFISNNISSISIIIIIISSIISSSFIISIICSTITNIIISIISSIISTIIRVAFLLALHSFVGGVQG